MERQEHQDTTRDDAAGADAIQGEGDYRAAREYREDVDEFLARADVAKAAREAAPRTKEEARQLEEAEEIGRSHARGSPARPLRSAISHRPVTAMLVAGFLGYLIGWASHRQRERTV